MEMRMTSWEKVQDSLTMMQDDLSFIQDVQCQLSATVTDMGESLDTLVNTEQPASPPVVDDPVVDSVSSKTGAKELSPLLEKEEEEEDWVGKGLPNVRQKTTSMKAFTSRTFGGSMVSEGHQIVSPPKMTSFENSGGPSTSGEDSTSKRAGKIPPGDKPDSPESSVSMGVVLAGLCVGQLKMDIPLVFIASRQQNVRGWLTKMERLFRLMRYPADMWIEIVATRLTEAVEAQFNGESQWIETGVRRGWRSWAEFRQEITSAFKPMTGTKQRRRQIIELRQTGRVSGYIQQFRTLRYKIPSMTQEEAQSLFLCGLNAGLQQ